MGKNGTRVRDVKQNNKMKTQQTAKVKQKQQDGKPNSQRNKTNRSIEAQKKTNR